MIAFVYSFILSNTSVLIRDRPLALVLFYSLESSFCPKMSCESYVSLLKQEPHMIFYLPYKCQKWK